MKSLKTETEQEVGKSLENIFVNCSDSIEAKLENFPKYVRRQHLKRFLAMYELFKLILPVKGSIVECGVFRGFSLMSWAKLSTILEPENLTRRIYGFDTFNGFPSVSSSDRNGSGVAEVGDFQASSYEELLELIRLYDQDRFLGHIPKMQLIRGDVIKTIPEFVQQNRHLLVSLLFIDLDLYEPTKVALEQIVPRMPKGAIIAFDELDNPIWPGETEALLEKLSVNQLEIRRLDWDPYIGYAILE
ncbi:MAG: dTDP-6-deoxy-L-hexose 3-O-methyltransferase [Acidobacteria bacterium 13_1_40CM_4_58_4]|nr:MAG: dTDP-6-deoxy-L-hexose 3-O-methyltransferase [Acidobacteria bacterium 13_1_40CM_4_58_4]